MNNSCYKDIFFALCLILLASCKEQSEPPQPHQANASQSPKGVEPTNAEVGNSGEGAIDESKLPMSERHQYLDLIVQNNTGGKIDNVSVIFGKSPCAFGVLSAGASAGYLGWQRPVGTNVVVKWRDSSKTSREAGVDVLAAYKPEIPGQMTFTIAGTNVTVKFEKLDRNM